MEQLKGTTIIAVKRDGVTAIAGDGQVTMGQQAVMKAHAKKVRRLYHDRVVVGFAGSTADAFTLCDRFEAKLEMHGGALKRAAIALAQEWRGDKMMRQLEAMMIVADKDDLLVLSGTGDVVEPDDDIAAIGSGGLYALSAAKALKEHTEMDAEQIVKEAMAIASSVCIFTNGNISVEVIRQ